MHLQHDQQTFSAVQRTSSIAPFFRCLLGMESDAIYGARSPARRLPNTSATWCKVMPQGADSDCLAVDTDLQHAYETNRHRRRCCVVQACPANGAGEVTGPGSIEGGVRAGYAHVGPQCVEMFH
jgi:hypothetical protein